MIKQARFFLLIIIISSCANSQESWQEHQFSRLNYDESEFKINNLDFKQFLDLFYNIPLPLNYSLGYKDEERIFPFETEQRSFKISTKYLMKYLGLKKEDLIYRYYDTDAALENEVKKKWYSGQAFFISRNLIGLEVDTSYYTTDPIGGQTILYIFNPKGEILDSMILKGSINEHGTYDSFVLLHAKHFKTFRYTINESNTELIDYAFEDFYVKYKDEEGYRSKCVITDYKITEEGKIKQISISDPILLKQDAWKYTDSSLPSFKDDPMNQDWEKYVKEKGY